MDFKQTVQTVWNMFWTNISIMEKKTQKIFSMDEGF